MACWVYESLLAGSIVWIAGMAVALAAHPLPAGLRPHAIQAILFAVLGVYFVGFWSHGQTLAMKTWRIRIVDRHGQPPSRARALWRYVCSSVWLLPPLAVLAPFHLRVAEIALLMTGWIVVWALSSRLHPQRQFWHDAWAGTRLIDTRAC
jgi:uncharacterized RDD family membrane protein YckC